MRKLVDQDLSRGADRALETIAAAQQFALGEGSAVTESREGQRHQRYLVEQLRDLFELIAGLKQHAEALLRRPAHRRIEVEKRLQRQDEAAIAGQCVGALGMAPL